MDFFDNMYWRIWQNSKRLNQYRQCQSLDDYSGTFKLLGIQNSLHKSERYIYNFTQKIEKIQRLLGDWSLRNMIVCHLQISELSCQRTN
jgi:hypothetical protein